MHLQRHPIASAITTTLACSLLAACGGGSAGSGQLGLSASSTPPPLPPAPPPPPPICPMPITGDCTVTVEGQMLGGRDSSGAFVLALPAPTPARDSTVFVGSTNDAISPDLRQATYTFAGGTEIRSGYMSIEPGNTWISNVALRLSSQQAAHLWVNGLLVGNLDNRDAGVSVGRSGTIRGNIENAGVIYLSGKVEGDIANRADLYFSGGSVLGNLVNTGRLSFEPWELKAGDAHVRGTLTLDASGEFRLALGSTAERGVPFTVQGRAELGGTLALYPAYDGWGGAALPGIGSHRLLHASDGVFGTFARWEGRELFLTGRVRYEPNDVWFDLERVSFSAAMASSGLATPLTLASAGNLERALSFAEGNPGSSNLAQRQFLANTGRLLWLHDAEQAARTLDSLAGSLHVDALQSLAQDNGLARGIGQRTLALQPGRMAGAWSRVQGDARLGGFDHWLSPGLLVGAVASDAGGRQDDTLGGSAAHRAPQAALYLRWFGNDGWYAGGSAGYAHHALALDRRIDLADGGQWNAHAQRRLGIASLSAEAGRELRFGHTTLAPYTALDARVLRSERALEQGHTGFELALQANTQALLDAGIGVRAQRRWQFGNSGWLQLEADASYRQCVMHAGDPLRAAFTGVPDLWFDVPGHAARDGGWLDAGLHGGFGRGWAWSLGHSGSLAGHHHDPRWQFGLRRAL